MARFQGENREKNEELIAALTDIASWYDVVPAQVALAWLHHRAAVHGLSVIPIPGTRKPSRVTENVAGATLVPATEDFEILDRLAHAVKGDRGRMI